MVEVARRAFEEKGVVVKVGFNHRFHPALRKAREIFESDWETSSKATLCSSTRPT